MNRKLVVAALFAIAAATPALTAWAQSGETTEGEVTEIDGKKVRVVYKKKEEINFDDVLIQGELKKPQGAYLLNRKKSDFSDMIEERAHFKVELRNSLDDI
ncbi:MAG TPA: hypothetical protein VMV18_10500 [bacterium]|nr:hypothetical protein [bacterium]